jgi:hypothetical protein
LRLAEYSGDALNDFLTVRAYLAGVLDAQRLARLGASPVPLEIRRGAPTAAGRHDLSRSRGSPMSTVATGTTSNISNRDRPTILIVDDTPDSIMLLSGLLKDGCNTKVANNGGLALQIAQATPGLT